MLRLFANANYDFIGVRRYAYGVTAAFILPGLLFLLITGLNYSIEFTGGTLVQIQSKKTVDVAQLRTGLDRQGIHGAEIQNFGSPNEYRDPRPGGQAGHRRQRHPGHRRRGAPGARPACWARGTTRCSAPRRSAPRSAASSGRRRSSRSSSRSSRCWPTWPTGSSGASASRPSSRPRTTSSPPSRSSACMRLEVSLTVVAAVLSMVGYSLNDTIIIFDRVRENLKKHKQRSVRADPEPLDQRDAAAERADPRHHAGHAHRADHLRRRGDPAVRPGHVLRRVHRHVLLDLHRLAGPDGDREAVARPLARGHLAPDARRPRPAGRKRAAGETAARCG